MGRWNIVCGIWALRKKRRKVDGENRDEDAGMATRAVLRFFGCCNKRFTENENTDEEVKRERRGKKLDSGQVSLFSTALTLSMAKEQS